MVIIKRIKSKKIVIKYNLKIRTCAILVTRVTSKNIRKYKQSFTLSILLL